MKTIHLELDVDFIGSQPSKLTKEEEKAISEYIRKHKAKTKNFNLKYGQNTK